jgi:predicted nuclease with TOPRIM domain
MTEPDEALLSVRRYWADRSERQGFSEIAEAYRSGKSDKSLRQEARAYRAGQAASAERIKALEEENAALEEMAGTYQVRMSDMLTRLHERYPEDFVWLKEADQ